MKTIQYKIPPMPKLPAPLRLTKFLGIDQSQSPTEIDITKSPEMLNMRIAQNGKPEKRNGYDKVFPTSLGAGAITGLTTFTNANGNTEVLIAHGSMLFRLSDIDI